MSLINYGSSVRFKIVPNAYHDLPAGISVKNATLQSYDSATGIAVIKNPTGNVTVTATCPETNYTFTATWTNVTVEPYDYTNRQITHTDEMILTVKAKSGYFITKDLVKHTGDHVAVENNDDGSVTVYVYDATSDINVTAVAELDVYRITGTVANGTAEGDTTCTIQQNAYITITPNDGYYVKNADAITVTNADFEWDADLNKLIIKNPTGDVTYSVNCVNNTKLSAPTNLSVNGTVLSFATSPNATSYTIQIDGTTLGTYTPGVSDGIIGTWRLKDAITPVTVTGGEAVFTVSGTFTALRGTQSLSQIVLYADPTGQGVFTSHKSYVVLESELNTAAYCYAEIADGTYMPSTTAYYVASENHLDGNTETIDSGDSEFNSARQFTITSIEAVESGSGYTAELLAEWLAANATKLS